MRDRCRKKSRQRTLPTEKAPCDLASWAARHTKELILLEDGDLGRSAALASAHMTRPAQIRDGANPRTARAVLLRPAS
jgi:hypothetical protein